MGCHLQLSWGVTSSYHSVVPSSWDIQAKQLSRGVTIHAKQLL